MTFDLFKEAIAWGKVYGAHIPTKQWDELRDKQAQMFAARSTEQAALPAPMSEPIYQIRAYMSKLWNEVTKETYETTLYERRIVYAAPPQAVVAQPVDHSQEELWGIVRRLERGYGAGECAQELRSFICRQSPQAKAGDKHD